MLRVFICGAHSTGKTTLVNEVGKELNLHVEAEVARNVITDLNLRREDFDPNSNPEKFEQLQEKILEAQSVVEKRNSRTGTSYIADRGIDPLVYALVYLGEDSMKKLLDLPTCKESINRYRNSLVFVVQPFPECLCPDHIRLVPKMDELLEYTNKMEAILQENEIPYTLIDVLNLKERVEIVKQKIMEYKAFSLTRTNKNVFVRDDWVHCNL